MIPHTIRVLTVSGTCVYTTPHRERGHAVYSRARLKSAVSGAPQTGDFSLTHRVASVILVRPIGRLCIEEISSN
jgi:hypothetical protein